MLCILVICFGFAVPVPVYAPPPPPPRVLAVPDPALDCARARPGACGPVVDDLDRFPVRSDRR